MRYALLLKSHANVRYMQSLEKLALAELSCILQAWVPSASPVIETIAETRFLTFEAENVSDLAWAAISRHSSISFAACMEGDLLRPMPLVRPMYLPSDLAEVLKYKGKTNADFTAMALHCAHSTSDFSQLGEPLTVLDPFCGRGTTLFCALQEGHHAIGVDLDTKALTEADTYFARYAKYHKIKHRREASSLTISATQSAKEIRYLLANTPENYRHGDTRTLRLLAGDARNIGRMLGRERCHLVVGDLPYGVQHAPGKSGGRSSLQELIDGSMPAYASVLKRGGAIALSFNTYTLPRTLVEAAMRNAGLTVLGEPPYGDFSHWVEQAVNRDLVVARQEK